MEPESSLPYSQVPATCPYPEPISTKTETNRLISVPKYIAKHTQ
jgi:hypothetical protein